jgi:pimeloyl-ACP methyl ester carboxylesterase
MPREGLTLRGLRWHGNHQAVLLVHDLGADVDCWGVLPDDLTSEGYTVLAIDLPGHGLSDGDWRPELLDPAVAAAYHAVMASGARAVFLIAAGIAATTAVTGFHARVALSPRLATAPSAALRDALSVPTLILAGAGEEERAAAQALYRHCTGWTVLSSFGAVPPGTPLLESAWESHAREQILAFLADYRVLR